MPKNNKTNYQEIDDIREDISSLKSNIVELTKHLKNDAKSEAKDLKETTLNQIDQLKDSGANQYHQIEKQVKANPGQSVAIAFAAGVVASLLMNRR